ncbi:thiolase family protein [Microbacterium rhizomatis]|uniref:Thiolase family protein n=1 Tax=Microbacterium rhizomatis TaxID=1631477 RepID=A0A5J5IYG2_9MICO|nr:thiolase family protein [Microbacterium rhizomatis]
MIVAARRTPISTAGGRLSRFGVEGLAAAALRSAAADAAIATGRDIAVGDVILGNCMGPGGNIARLGALAAGFDLTVPGMTVDRQCGSGLAAVATAADAIRAGEARMILAGGAESASTAPLRIADGRAYPRAAFAPAGFPDPEMGPAAEALAAHDDIDRGAQDAYALRSHNLARAAELSGRFDAEIVPVGGVHHDDGPRDGLERMLSRFAPLHPGQAPDGVGTVTAGNSCRISDGAAAVALVPASARRGAPGLAVIGHATVGCDPALPGVGPVAAVERLLGMTRVTLDDVAAIEIVEAFAAQALAVLGRLGLRTGEGIDPRVCADGGALALGHPWGASGAIGIVRLFSRLVRSGAPAGTRGLAMAAVGGGMGVALLVEVVR